MDKVSITVIDQEVGFKSWREEFTGEDVEKHLEDNKVVDLVYHGICGDGDIIFVTTKSLGTCVSLDELNRIKELFSAVSMTIELYENELLVTLSWNA